jgi:conjugative relaxase-like TrwC/TraI family protein
VTADLHKLSAGRADYYLREIAKDREEYLSGQGESPGEWLGGSTAALGLRGECSPEEFQQVFAWRHPQTVEQLGRAPRSDAMPAWDLVLRPVKDVSVLYALGDDRTRRATRQAHQLGVEAAVAYLDRQVGTRRGRGGAEHVGGAGLLAVGFTHRVSRAGDPLLHTHLVIVNRTLGPDGQWRTLDSRDLLAHRQAADAIYRAAYQHELTRSLGIRWTEPERWGNRAIQGMPSELVKAFSKRHEQITAELDRLEREDGKPRTGRLVQYVAHATRPPKTHETPETLYGRWRQVARERGLDPERLVREVTGRELREPAAAANLAVKRAFNQLAGPDGLTANASTFARREVLVALGGQLAATTPAELERLADRFLAERCVSVMAEHAAGERRYTTPELLQVEQRLIAVAADRAGEQTAVAAHAAVREALAVHPTIAGEQAAMVRDITQGGAGVQVVVGKAGTGKTFTLGVARHAWQLDGYKVLGAAPTGIATVCLGAEGFEEVATVDRLLAELDAAGGGRRGPDRAGGGQGGDASPLDSRTVLVVDEAGMVGSRKLARLLDHAQHAGAKVVLVGDDRQLAAIEAGGGFRGLRLRLGAKCPLGEPPAAGDLGAAGGRAPAQRRPGHRPGCLSGARSAGGRRDPHPAQGDPAGRVVAGLPAGRAGGDPGPPPLRGRPVQHRVPAAPPAHRPARRRAAAGRRLRLCGRGRGGVRQERAALAWGRQRHPRPGHRHRPHRADDHPGARERPPRHPHQGLPGGAAALVAARQS